MKLLPEQKSSVSSAPATSHSSKSTIAALTMLAFLALAEQSCKHDSTSPTTKITASDSYKTPKYQVKQGDNGTYIVSQHNLKHGLSASTPIMNMALGLSGNDREIPETLTVNMRENMKNLREKKMKRVWKDTKGKFGTSGKKVRTEEEAATKRERLQTAEPSDELRLRDPAAYHYITEVRPYVVGTKDIHPIDIGGFISTADTHISEIQNNIDRAKVAKEYNLSEEKKAALIQAAKTINGEDIVSYCLTELMEDQQNGDFNIDLLNFYGEIGGKEFLEDFPAIYDGRTSHGMFQFTSNALYAVDGQEEGASRINNALPTSIQIPNSVIDMKFDDHIKAAYIFAINNLAQGIKGLSPHEAKRLELATTDSRKQNTLVQYIAMAHNLPTGARAALKDRCAHNCTGELYATGAKRAPTQYGRKTAVNLSALKKRRANGEEVANQTIDSNTTTELPRDKVNVQHTAPVAITPPAAPKETKQTIIAKGKKDITETLKKPLPPKKPTPPQKIEDRPTIALKRVKGDKKSDTYEYILQNKSGGNVGGIKNKVQQKLGRKATKGKEITVVNVHGKPFPKDKRFEHGEKVYVTVAK